MTSKHLLVAGHIVIDSVIREEGQTETLLGGPPCYAGLAAKNLGANVTLVTKFGVDFPEEYYLWLVRNQLKFASSSRSLTQPTTRFRIMLHRDKRILFLVKQCEELSPDQIKGLEAAGMLVSPVAGEISMKFLEEAANRFPVIYLDPQGFLRSFGKDGRCVLKRQSFDALKFAQILKVDEDEAYAYTGMNNMVNALKVLARSGPEIVIGTRGSKPILLLHKKHIYQIPVRQVNDIVDTTGTGDIFAGAFMAEFLREKDPVWAACLAGTMASSGVNKVGLAKITRRGTVVKEAETLHKKVTEVKA
ncbi:MAG: hypothetical protein HY619_05845 [Thaumarchaeota archaeon]|nr:hypothetical protein [Nitrososphaerota archaeon]